MRTFISRNRYLFIGFVITVVTMTTVNQFIDLDRTAVILGGVLMALNSFCAGMDSGRQERLDATASRE